MGSDPVDDADRRRHVGRLVQRPVRAPGDIVRVGGRRAGGQGDGSSGDNHDVSTSAHDPGDHSSSAGACGAGDDSCAD